MSVEYNDNLVILKNSDMDQNYLKNIQLLSPNYIPSQKFSLNRTILINNEAIFKLDIWVNPSGLIPIYIKNNNAFISYLKTIMKYLTSTIKSVNPLFDIANEI